jgi:hypothetical protein
MRFWLILFAAVLAVVFVKRRRLARLAQPLLIILLAIVLLLLGLTWFGGAARMTRYGATYVIEQAAAATMGARIAAEHPDGEIVLIQPGWESKFSQAQERGLRQALDPRRHVVHIHALATQYPDSGAVEYRHITWKMLQDTVQQYPAAKALVVCVGLPPIPRHITARDLPPLYVLAVSESGVPQSLFRRGIVRAALRYRPGIDWMAKPEPRMPVEDIFNLRYELLTPDVNPAGDA